MKSAGKTRILMSARIAACAGSGFWNGVSRYPRLRRCLRSCWPRSRSVYQRLETERGGLWILQPAPALAAVSLVVLGVLLSEPVPPPQPTLASNDAQFYTEIYSLVENTEPEAMAPIYGLFED